MLRIQQETKETSRKIIPGRGDNLWKGPEAGQCLECWRNSEAGASKHVREPLTETAHLGQAWPTCMSCLTTGSPDKEHGAASEN